MTRVTIPNAIRSGDYPGLLQAVRQAGGWNSVAAEQVHHALVTWCERALALAGGQAQNACMALYDLIGRLRATHGDAMLDAAQPGLAMQWRGFELLLDERMAVLAANREEQAAQRDRVLALRHADRVIELLAASGSLELSTLRDRLGVSESSLSQLLARMERAGLVVRERAVGDGRARRVRLTDAEAGRQQKSPPAEGRAGHPHQGMAWAYGLVDKAAA